MPANSFAKCNMHNYFSIHILLAEGCVGGEEDVLVPALVAGVLGLQLGGPPARAQEGGEQPALGSHHLVLGTPVSILPGGKVIKSLVESLLIWKNIAGAW